MPLYPYRCTTCGCRFDVLAPIAERDRGQRCRRCGQDDARRLVAGVTLGNQARIGIGRAAHPQTWEDVGGGHPDATRYWTGRVDKEMAEEQRHPELTTMRAANAARLAERASGRSGVSAGEPAPGDQGQPA